MIFKFSWSVTVTCSDTDDTPIGKWNQYLGGILPIVESPIDQLLLMTCSVQLQLLIVVYSTTIC